MRIDPSLAKVVGSRIKKGYRKPQNYVPSLEEVIENVKRYSKEMRKKANK